MPIFSEMVRAEASKAKPIMKNFWKPFCMASEAASWTRLAGIAESLGPKAMAVFVSIPSLSRQTHLECR